MLAEADGAPAHGSGREDPPPHRTPRRAARRIGRCSPWPCPPWPSAPLLSALEERYPIAALGVDLLAPNSVLQPRLQEVYALVDERLRELSPALGDGLRCLDMGCGSGALTLTVARALSAKAAAIWATDLLPEALATTRPQRGALRRGGHRSPGPGASQ